MQVQTCSTHTPLLQEVLQDLSPDGKEHVIRSTQTKVAHRAGHAHMATRKILKADAICVDAHNTLPRNARGA
eukprot:12921701-Prorocentrum_lima.AAC.1